MRELGVLWAAEAFIATAARKEPGLVSAWQSLAAVQEEQGKIVDAIATYRTVLEASPDNPDGHFNLALCYEKAGRPEEAFQHWFAYLKIDSASPSAQVAKRHLAVRPPGPSCR